MENSKIKDEVLRYLGYRGQKIDSTTDALVDQAMVEIKSLIRERHIYKSFPISREEDWINLKGTSLKLFGHDIKNHLSKSKSCILMAVTLGHGVDTRIRYYEKTSMTKALILDACATAFIEEVCDKLVLEIQSKLEEGKVLTSRYSPGYGDLPIDMQSDFLSTIDAKKSIGLNASSHSILIPRKSVTAILGVIDKENKKEETSCISCNKNFTCNFRKVGKTCGY